MKKILSPFFVMLGSSFFCTVIYFTVSFYLGGERGIVFGTVLIAQVHFIFTYLFSFPNLKRNMGLLRVILLYLVLIALPFLFYSRLFPFVQQYWVVAALFLYFLFHFYENLFFLWGATGSGSEPKGPDRILLFLLFGVVNLLAILPSAELFGTRNFLRGAIIFSGISSGVYWVFIVFSLFIFCVLFFQRDSAYSKWIIGALGGTTIGTYLFSFVSPSLPVFFQITWHIFMWLIFYTWKIWGRNPTFRLFSMPTGIIPKTYFAKFLVFISSGIVPFLGANSLLMGISFVYFWIDYDGSAARYFFHPFYGQFALFIWSFSHTTFSFFPTRTKSV